MDIFTAAPHQDLLALLVQVGILLVAARGMGELAGRLGQPPVLGELLAGILLGPSLLSGLLPELGAWIVPQTEVQGYLLELVALVGVLFLLIITGLQTDLGLIVQHARTALGVSWGGILACATGGLALGFWLPDALLADPDRRLVFALLLATALSISAIPVIAKVLIDMNLIRRDIGQTILAAAMNDGTIGWILLGVVAGIASTGDVSGGAFTRALGSVLLFLIASFTIGRWLVERSLSFVQDRMAGRDRLLTLVVAMSIGWAALTHALRLEAVLGAFVMGILFGQMRRLPATVNRKLESITLGVFAPIFFAAAGLKVDIISLLDPFLIGVTLLVIAVATLAKVAGTYVGARAIGRRDHWTALSYGAGLNARGALEIIVAMIGLQLGVLGQDMFSIIVVMAMVTSLMAPVALRYTLKRVTPGDDEMKRLRREALAETSLFGDLRRVLLPIRCGDAMTKGVDGLEARVLEALSGGRELALTLFTAAGPERRPAAVTSLERLSALFTDRDVLRKVVPDGRPAERILEEARKDYDLLVLGVPERDGADDVLFDPIVDHLVRSAPCPTVVVSGTMPRPDWRPRRILVPTNGTLASRRAAELAFALTRPGDGGSVTVLHTIVENGRPHPYELEGVRLDGRLALGREIVDELCEIGRSLDIETEAEVGCGSDPETVILECASRHGVDLIVMGTDVRPGTDRLFLGERVERILSHAPCPVAVVNAIRA